MEILFHPSFDSGYYLDWNLETLKLGKKIVGTAGLLDYLSLHNGLSGRFASDGERAASYLAEVGKCAKGSWIDNPFNNDSLGVAKCLLGWRDLLIMAGWTPDKNGTEQTPKLQLLSSIEGSWKARIKGSADRWLELTTLAAKQPLVDEGDALNVSARKNSCLCSCKRYWWPAMRCLPSIRMRCGFLTDLRSKCCITTTSSMPIARWPQDR